MIVCSFSHHSSFGESHLILGGDIDSSGMGRHVRVDRLLARHWLEEVESMAGLIVVQHFGAGAVE